MKPQRLRYSRPGWTLDVDKETSYIVWAPNKTRVNWAASISSEGGYGGSFAYGDTMEDAMQQAAFSDEVQKLFLDITQ